MNEGKHVFIFFSTIGFIYYSRQLHLIESLRTFTTTSPQSTLNTLISSSLDLLPVAAALAPPGLVLVLLNVEVEEQAEEEDHETGRDDGKLPRVAALGAQTEDDDQALGEHGGELDHLEGGEVLLPPEVGLHLGTEGGEEVVRVHQDVNHGVDETAERLLATWANK